MTGDDATLIAQAVMAELGQHVIPARLPAEAGEWIRATTKGHQMYNMFSMSLGGGQSIGWKFTLTATGAIHIEITDSYGAWIWEGTLVPAEPVT